ncbi:hypothetical protein N007_02510 [Alicyclobacillus acidoterrestris ATCC 49025]|nr:hypothetical protein N007_02510 [Alicyclobacillus acidoterrestris ATCC 49025]
MIPFGLVNDISTLKSRIGARFYSWLGGVHPEFRGRGIANELMRRQHVWCEKQGLHVIRTQTRNTWRDMLILNIRNGFNIVGTRTEKGDTTILLEKRRSLYRTGLILRADREIINS